MHQLVFSGDVAGSDNGKVGNVRVMYFQPLTERVTGLIGIGMTVANDKFVQTYYGIYGSDIALFPSLGGREYNPSACASRAEAQFRAHTDRGLTISAVAKELGLPVSRVSRLIARAESAQKARP
jgi:outer membrane scaffolding protein for murein synthesis (MipA/OmpV family)